MLHCNNILTFQWANMTKTNIRFVYIILTNYEYDIHTFSCLTLVLKYETHIIYKLIKYVMAETFLADFYNFQCLEEKQHHPFDENPNHRNCHNRASTKATKLTNEAYGR